MLINHIKYLIDFTDMDGVRKSITMINLDKELKCEHIPIYNEFSARYYIDDAEGLVSIRADNSTSNIDLDYAKENHVKEIVMTPTNLVNVIRLDHSIDRELLNKLIAANAKRITIQFNDDSIIVEYKFDCIEPNSEKVSTRFNVIHINIK